MSVKVLGDSFTSELHRIAMKPRGFKKAGRIFTYERDDYIEQLQIQGSHWNSGDEPWMFYINIRVRFKGLPNSFASKGTHYDADGRLEGLIPEAPPRFDLTAATLNRTVAEVAQFAAEASLRLPDVLPPIRKRASRGLFSPLPLPDTWCDDE